MTVVVLTICHTQYTWDSSICVFYLIEQHSKFLLHTLQLLSASSYSSFSSTPYKRLSVLFHLLSCQRRPTSHFPFSHAPCILKLCIPPSNKVVRWWLFPEFGVEFRWTIVTDRHSWNVSTQNALSLPFAAILVNCAPSGQMRNYCIPHIIKQNFENFLIHRCNFTPLSEVYCVWQVVKTRTIILNNPVLSYTRLVKNIRY